MPVLTRENALRAVREGRSARVDQPVAPSFKTGERIVVKNRNPTGHTRMQGGWSQWRHGKGINRMET